MHPSCSLDCFHFVEAKYILSWLFLILSWLSRVINFITFCVIFYHTKCVDSKTKQKSSLGLRSKLQIPISGKIPISALIPILEMGLGHL